MFRHTDAWKTDPGWIFSALFKLLSGKVEYDSQNTTKFWYEPAQPRVRCTQAPKVDYFFTTSLLHWMPRHFWKVVLRCTEKKCYGQELISAG